MDDRFDMRMVSSELLDSSGLNYVAGSDDIVGNNGTHTLGGLITSGTGAAFDVSNALSSSSDHLPVLTDYAYSVHEPALGLTTAFASVMLLGRCRTA